jgi:hypothetical protein
MSALSVWPLRLSRGGDRRVVVRELELSGGLCSEASAVSLTSLASALPAGPPGLVGLAVSVLRVELVTLLAVGLACVSLGRTVSLATLVDEGWHRFEMSWIDTRGLVAQMVDLEAGRD